jgi:hypothetical protein
MIWPVRLLSHGNLKHKCHGAWPSRKRFWTQSTPDRRSVCFVPSFSSFRVMTRRCTICRDDAYQVPCSLHRHSFNAVVNADSNETGTSQQSFHASVIFNYFFFICGRVLDEPLLSIQCPIGKRIVSKNDLYWSWSRSDFQRITTFW